MRVRHPRGKHPGRRGLPPERQPRGEAAKARRRILLVDPHRLMRRAAAEWIRRCPELEICGMTGAMAGAFRAVRRLRPDLVVSEILRPRDLGFVRELRRRYPRLPILVFSFGRHAVYRVRARAAGASEYLRKEAGGARLVRAIRALVGG
jgi:two-component system, NarL family, response regulator, fimbrial Z protein, FimZ